MRGNAQLTPITLAGGAYLRRLFMLVLDRTEALKRMLMITPGPLHHPTAFCGPKERSRDVLGPWGLTASQLMTSARADVSAARLEATLNPLLLQCACAECRIAIQNRIRAIVSEWLRVRVSGAKLVHAVGPSMLTRRLANPKVHDIEQFSQFVNATSFQQKILSLCLASEGIRGGE